jgi:hypothetical protein
MASSQPVAIIDDNVARQYWPNEDPIGKRIRQHSTRPSMEIIGVVGHARSSFATNSERGVVYHPIYQRPEPMALLLVRTDIDPTGVAAGMRDVVGSIDPNQPYSRLEGDAGPRIFRPQHSTICRRLDGCLRRNCSLYGSDRDIRGY